MDEYCEAVNVVLATCTITKNATLASGQLWCVAICPDLDQPLQCDVKEYYNSIFKRMGRLKCNMQFCQIIH